MAARMLVLGLWLVSVGALAQPSAELQRINSMLHANFTADGSRPPGLGSVRYIRTGERRFSGNCTHFAFAAYYQLQRAGLAPVMVAVNGRHRGQRFWHLIACSHSEDWCLDNESSRPYTGSSILDRYNEIEEIFTVSDDVFADH